MTIDKTPNVRLNKIKRGTRDWEKHLNENVDILDTEIKGIKDRDTLQDTRINNIVAQAGTSNTEIVDARNSYTGRTYPNLKNRLDDMERYVQTQAYGLQWNFITDTYTRVGLAANLTQSSFNNIMPWSGMRRVNLADDGETINAFFGDPTYKEDGSNGQVMVLVPEYWYKRDFSDTTITTWISPVYTDGFEKHPTYFKNDIEKSRFFFSAFEGSLFDVSANSYLINDEQVADFTVNTGDKLCSIAGVKPASGLTQNLTLPNSRILANNRGANWGLIDYDAVSAIQMLLLVEYASYNSQSRIGQGVVNKPSGTGNESEITGQTSTLGNVSGMASGTNGLVSVSYRGIENFWGNIWSWVDGLNIRNGVPFINTKNINFISNKFDEHYVSVGGNLPSSGFVRNLMMTEKSKYGFIPATTGASSSTFITDHLWTNLSGNFVAVLGGEWARGANAGAFCWFLSNSAAFRSHSIGARLLCR